MKSLEFSLSDKNLMAHFTQDIYYPLLDFLPKDWFNDFDKIILKFDQAEYVSYATMEGKKFTLNIDLAKLEHMTIKQLVEESTLNTIIFQYFGNLAWIITRAFHKYNKNKHPEVVKGYEPETLTNTFMTNIAEKIRKNNNCWTEYIV